MGGEIMFVEATKMGGEGKLSLTGQLGKFIVDKSFVNWCLRRTPFFLHRTQS